MSLRENFDKAGPSTKHGEGRIVLRQREAMALHEISRLRHIAIQAQSIAPESREYGDAIRAVDAARAEAITAGMLANLIDADPSGKQLNDARALAKQLEASPDDFFKSVKGTPFLSEALSKAVRNVDKADPVPQAKPSAYDRNREVPPTRREMMRIVGIVTAAGAVSGFNLGAANHPEAPTKYGATGGVVGAAGGRAVGFGVAALEEQALTVAVRESEFSHIQALIANGFSNPQAVDAALHKTASAPITLDQVVDRYIAARLNVTFALKQLQRPEAAIRRKDLEALETRWQDVDTKIRQAMHLDQQGYDVGNLYALSIKFLHFFRDGFDEPLAQSRVTEPDGSVIHAKCVMEEAEMSIDMLEAAINSRSEALRLAHRGTGAPAR
jgi:hypothetical protein